MRRPVRIASCPGPCQYELPNLCALNFVVIGLVPYLGGIVQFPSLGYGYGLTWRCQSAGDAVTASVRSRS